MLNSVMLCLEAYSLSTIIWIYQSCTSCHFSFVPTVTIEYKYDWIYSKKNIGRGKSSKFLDLKATNQLLIINNLIVCQFDKQKHYYPQCWHPGKFNFCWKALWLCLCGEWELNVWQRLEAYSFSTTLEINPVLEMLCTGLDPVYSITFS